MKENKRKLNKLKISIVLLIVILFITITVFGRYIYNSARDMYLSSRNFYFTSNLLEVNTAEYHFNNWNGTGEYKINFSLFSYNDKLQKMDYDLKYTLTCSVADNTKAKCAIGSAAGPTTISNGVIYKANNNESAITLYVTPVTTTVENEDGTSQEVSALSMGDEVEVLITAKTDSPFAKEISASYTVTISDENTSYSIEDAVNQNYATLQLVNSEDTGSTVTVAFDPEILRLDMNDSVYPIITGSTTGVVEKDEVEYEYINSITFVMEPEASRNIKFYKVNSSANYTYPYAGNTSVITVTSEE